MSASSRQQFGDRFAWLEQNTDQTARWDRVQDAAARSFLHDAQYDGLRDALVPILAETGLSAPLRRGPYWFRLALANGATGLWISTCPTELGLLLVNPTDHGSPEQPCSIDWFFPSPDGRKVAFGLSLAGDEQSVLHVISVDDRRFLPTRIPFTSMATVAWLPQGDGFYYNASRQADWLDADKQIFLHMLGDAEPRPPEPLSLPEAYALAPQVSPDGRWLLAITSEVTPRADLIKRLPDGPWRPFLGDVRGSAFGVFGEDDTYVAIVTEDAPRGRLVSIPIATAADRSTWVDLIPESDAVLRTVDRIGTSYVVCDLVDCSHRIRVIDLPSGNTEDVPLPHTGIAMAVARQGMAQSAAPWMGRCISPGVDEFTFAFASPEISPALYLFDLEHRRLEALTQPRFVHDWVVHSATASGLDETEVRYRIIHQRNLPTDQPHPTLITAYGGWNVSFLPGYCGTYGPFIDGGGVLALAHLRGGGEFGAQHWQQGRLASKQHTFDDLYAVAESLVARGVANDALGFVGASNGALTAGAALTQRPDLWRAVCLLVGFYDLIGFKRDSYSATFALEYGDPDLDQRDWLLAYSPYHSIAKNTRYPATLVYSGANDMRCPLWHSRKFFARLQSADAGGEPILLRIRREAGHLAVKSDPSQVAEWLGFLMNQLLSKK